MNKKNKIASILIFGAILFLPLLALTAETPLVNPLGNVTFEQVTQRAIGVLLGIVGVLALIAFVYGGVVWMTSSGDSDKITKGKNIMLWAVWGLVIIFSAYAVLKVIFDALLPK